MNRLDGSMSEAELQGVIIEMAELYGWVWHHETDSRRTRPGFPDLVLVRPPTVMFIECKTVRGRIRPDQQTWLDALEGCDRVVSSVVRPGDLDDLTTALMRPAR